MRAGNQPAFGTGLPEHVRALLRGRGRVHVIVGRQGGHIRLDGEGMEQIGPEHKRFVVSRYPDAYMPGVCPASSTA